MCEVISCPYKMVPIILGSHLAMKMFLFGQGMKVFFRIMLATSHGNFKKASILQEATTMGQLQRKEEKLTLAIHLTSTMDFLLQGDWKIVPVAHGALTTT